MPNKKPLTYRDAGVDIDAGDALVSQIGSIVKSTHRPEVMAGVGGFGALVSLPKRYKQPVLVSGTDGVGTKLKMGIALGQLQGLGVDLVAMCVNDVLVSGAEPLFFLDYFATGKLEPDRAAQVIKGIAKGCRQAGCALVGGETAEMPGMYKAGDFDLAGFCVAVAEKKKIIDGSRIRAGDVLIALPSSGPHANGFSLIRKIVGRRSLDAKLGSRSIADQLMAPTRIYVKPVQKLLDAGVAIRGMSHITGGGLTENLPRCLPPGTSATLNTQSWKLPPIFDWLQQQGAVEDAEMRRVFNCGVGFVMAVPRKSADEAMGLLRRARQGAWVLGEVSKGDRDVRFV
ncbi:MAG: phosphoribosylformylglycinamidine cyclo-ligase [Panacagrimonas sp.]